MKYDEFLDYVRESVSQFMGEGYDVSIHKVLKNNGLELNGIVIMKAGNHATPTIYLDEFYEQYKRGKEVYEIIEEIVDLYDRHKDRMEIDFSFFSDFEIMRNKILYRLINYESNEALLNDVPHRRFLDLAIVYYVIVDSDTLGNGSVLLHQCHLDMWKVNEAEIYEIAKVNTKSFLEYRLSSMRDIAKMILGDDVCLEQMGMDNGCCDDIYVLSNNRKFYGAAAVLYDGMLDDIACGLNSNLYVIPSSVHEVIIIPQNVMPDCKDVLTGMVREINERDVEIVDRLSDYVYEYDREQKALHI